jgi:transposase InsO family protein
MSQFYDFFGISRQAHWQAAKRSQQQRVIFEEIRCFIQSQRRTHSGGGLKKLYHQMPDKPVGRDRFIAYATKAGLAQKRKKKHIRTTFSVFTVFTNLLANQTLTEINQAWSGDITYVRIGKKHAYVFLLMDIYSHRILGYIASDSMDASVNVSCLKMALKVRKGQSLKDTIHHSDRGSQYIAGDYLLLLQERKFQISMCCSALDNPYSERLNGIIKTEYLDEHQFENLTELKKALKISVEHYNNQRPHLNLNMMTPIEFEKQLSSDPIEKTIKIIVKPEHK